MRKSGFLTSLLALALVSCGGGSDATDDAFQPGAGGTDGGGGGGGGGATATAQLGSGTGAGFQVGTIGISNASVSAGGSTSLSVTLQQTDGNLYTTSSTVTFNSPCVAQGLAEIQPGSGAVTATGVATVTYVAKGCSGPDLVTATSAIAGSTRTATGTVTVAQAAIGTIAFVSATPANIALRGTGDPSRPEASTVVFRVLDAAGGPRAGANVAFALNTAVGGISLTPATATAVSDAQGQVQVVVNAGTVATSVKVTASVTSVTPAISTQSSQLTVTTGIPTAGSFSLAVGCFSTEGLDLDGTITPVTARLADRFGNPVPDGTAVTFTTEGGAIQAQCVTATTPSESGVCAVNWRSSNPRPLDGRVTLLAKAIGEESFADANGNGAFDNLEVFTDLAEPFRDDDENSTYTAGTDGDFFDFNNNGQRDAGDGLFNGVLCSDTSGRCGAPATRSTGIGVRNQIVMSGSTAVVTELNGSPPAAISMPISTSRLVQLWIRDVNGNAMPGASVVAATFSGTGAVLGQPSTFNVPCSTIQPNVQAGGTTVYSFGLSAAATAGAGLLNVTVTTPSGRSTLVQIPVTVTP